MKFHSTFDIFLPPKHYLIARCWLWSVDEKCLNVWLELKLWIKTTEIHRVILATIYRCIITIFKDCFKRVVEFMIPRTDIRLLWNCNIGIVGSFVSLKTIFLYFWVQSRQTKYNIYEMKALPMYPVQWPYCSYSKSAFSQHTEVSLWKFISNI